MFWALCSPHPHLIPHPPVKVARMKTQLLSLCAGLSVALTTAAIPAQVSSFDIIVAEGAFGATGTSAGLTLVNPTTAKSRAVQGITSGPFFKVALNTQNAADLWARPMPRLPPVTMQTRLRSSLTPAPARRRLPPAAPPVRCAYRRRSRGSCGYRIELDW